MQDIAKFSIATDFIKALADNNASIDDMVEALELVNKLIETLRAISLQPSLA